MWKGNKGFSLIESLIGFTGFLIVMCFLIPTLMTMITHLEHQKVELNASKLLYQNVEAYFYTDKVYENAMSIDSVAYYTSYVTNESNRKEKICVQSRKVETCLEDPGK